MSAIPEPDLNSPTWPFVLAFAKRVEYKLSLNRHKGDRDGWRKDHPGDLSQCIQNELGELNLALEEGGSADEIANECADVAAFAMMVADNVLNPV